MEVEVKIVIRQDAGGNWIGVVKAASGEEANIGFQAPSKQAAVEQIAGGMIVV